MPDTTSNTKRIAKNTMLLYFRMLLTMLVSLYTSRVVLNALGVEDYGIYNVVGGVVTMFSFIYGALVTSTQRYLTYELGKGNMEQLKKVFTASIHIYVVISVFIILLGETIGLLFFYNKMIIPDSRMTAAMWVYQFSIVTMVIQVMSAPYNSVIIAHEDMNVFAAVSILEVVLKLAIVYILLLCIGDKLIFYAIMLASIQLLIRFIYTFYCKKHYEESIIIKNFDKTLVIEMSKFAGWNIWGNLAATMFGTGVNLLLNVFFGPVVNAARAVAVQVESAIVQFSTNFLIAVNPQIIKSYAQNDFAGLHTLLYRSSKISCFLLLMLSLPVIMETEIILTLWLKIVPEYTISFLQLLLCIMIVDAIARPLITAATATGDVKKYQSIIGGILLTIVPISYFVLKLGAPPISVYIVHLIVAIVAFIVRLIIVRPMIKLSLSHYIKLVILPCFFVVVISFVISYVTKFALPETILSSIIVCLVSVLSVAVSSYFIGLTQRERTFIKEKIWTFFKRNK